MESASASETALSQRQSEKWKRQERSPEEVVTVLQTTPASKLKQHSTEEAKETEDKESALVKFANDYADEIITNEASPAFETYSLE